MLPVSISAQLTVKPQPQKQNIGMVRDIEMYRLIQKKDSLIDSVYVVSFKNEAFKTISDYKSFFFRNNKNELNDLYNILKSFYSPDNLKNKDYTVSIKLNKTDVFLMRYKKDIWFSIGDPYFIIGEKDLDKLFGIAK